MDGTDNTRQQPNGKDLPMFQCDHSNLFDLLKRRSAADLAGVFDGFFDAIAVQVHQAWLENADSGARQRDRELAATLRQRTARFVADYRTGVEDAFDDWLRPEQEAMPPGALSLMSDSQLQMQLLAQSVGEELAQQLEGALAVLDGRMAGLRAALGGVGDAGNPLRPLRLAQAFGAAFGAEDIGEALRQMLFREFARRLAPRLSALYAQVERELAGAGHPERREAGAGRPPAAAPAPAHQAWVPEGGTVEHLGPAPPQPAMAPPSPPAPAKAMPPDPVPKAGADGVPLRYRDIVREHLRQWRDRGLPAAANDDAAPVALGTQALQTVASLLQGDDPTFFVRQLGRADGRMLAGSIRQAMSTGARQLGLAPSGLRFAQDEEDAIDLVAMLFDCLVRTREPQVRESQGGVAHLYGRLVMPYVKIALLDDSLFNRRSHPARQLLDALTEVCEDDGLEHGSLDFAGGVVDRVVAGFREDLAIFELAVEELRQFQQQQQRRAELAERRAAEAVHGRERLQLARADSARELAAWLGRRPLAQATADFLRGPWRHAADQAWLRDGAESPRRRELTALGEALLALDAEATVARGEAIARGWLAQQARIAACCAVAGLDPAAADDTAARLVFAFAHPETARARHAADVDAGDPGGGEALPLHLAGGTDTVPHDPVLADRMRRLRVGQALRLIEEDGSESSARIAWISPLTARLLIVNRRGQRRLVLSPEQLAALVAAGRVALRAPTAPFDLAMQRLWRQLNEAREEPLAAAG